MLEEKREEALRAIFSYIYNPERKNSIMKEKMHAVHLTMVETLAS